MMAKSKEPADPVVTTDDTYVSPYAEPLDQPISVDPLPEAPATPPPPTAHGDAPPPSEDSLQQRERNLRGRGGSFEARLERLEAFILDDPRSPFRS